ncbi:MAG: 50S ribosomal protein L21 [Deltaproteobacteria bacterium]|nr:50S ribosomal protein L21 [Deltaproteobacteria bacterium]
MYAVISTGSRQYKVTEGDKISVEKLEGDVGSKLTLSEVLLVGSKEGLKVGSPLLKGATVEVEITEQAKGPKIRILKKKRRKGYRKQQGHRQFFTMLQIKKISA